MCFDSYLAYDDFKNLYEKMSTYKSIYHNTFQEIGCWAWLWQKKA